MSSTLIDFHLDVIALLLQILNPTITNLVAEEEVLFGKYERDGLGFHGFKVGHLQWAWMGRHDDFRCETGNRELE